VVVRTVRRNDGRGSENNRKGKNTAVSGFTKIGPVEVALFHEDGQTDGRTRGG
jgi:hypothetical protein